MAVNWQAQIKKPAIWLFIGQLFLLGLTLWVYWPGLAGPFLFDDFANLTALGDFNGVRNWETFKLYLFGNHSGPTGRPISMLSFLLNDTNWPSDPRSFKLTNLILHLTNGVLLYTLVRRILMTPASTGTNDANSWAAILAAGIWLLHPLNVSTVLYPVQRMTILATLFVLAGLLAYIHGRQMLGQHKLKAYLWMSGGISLGTILATLSKENGALLPLLAICLEVTLIHKVSTRLDWRWKTLFLWLPALLLAGYFLHGLVTGGITAGYGSRPFTLAERLLTQPRILLDYLYYWFIPHIGSPGLLTQDFILSKSWLEPITTLPVIMIIAGLIVSALIFRNRNPVFSLAILFYFTGHILESTVIPLELYFEHRNYLPGIFLFLPVVIGLVNYFKKPMNRITAAFMLILIPALLTSIRAEIWSDEELLADQWASIHPKSQRALRHAALVAESHDKYAKALDYMEKAKQGLPDKVAVELHWLTLACRTRPITTAERGNTLRLMREGYFSFKSYNLLRSTMEFIASPECLGVDRAFTYQIIDALRQNEFARKSGGARFQLYTIEGKLLLAEQKYTEAAKDFRHSLAQYQHMDGALLQVGLLASAGQYQLALDHIDYIRTNLNLDNKIGDLNYRKELEQLRKTISIDISRLKAPAR